MLIPEREINKNIENTALLLQIQAIQANFFKKRKKQGFYGAEWLIKGFQYDKHII